MELLTLFKMVLTFIGIQISNIIKFASETQWIGGITIYQWGALIFFSGIIIRFIRKWFNIGANKVERNHRMTKEIKL